MTVLGRPSERRYYMDASGRIRALVKGGFERAGLSGTETYAHMRFLDSQVGVF